MIRQLPAGFALVIRGGLAPVIARLPRAWNNPAYRRARRRAPPPPSAIRCRPTPSPTCTSTRRSSSPAGSTRQRDERPATSRHRSAFPDYPPPGWAAGDDPSFPWN